MRKFLIALLCLFCTFNAYCDGFEIDFNNIDTQKMVKSFIDGQVDLETAQTWCFKMFQYANAHDIDILFEKDGNILVQVDSSICDTNEYESEATGYAVMFAVKAAEWIKASEIKIHSESYQDAMELAAKSSCYDNPYVLSSQGYSIDGGVKPVVLCSAIDKRCLVFRRVTSNSGDTMYSATCCMIEKGGIYTHTTSYTDEYGTQTTTTSEGTVGDVSVYWGGIVRNVLSLSDFGYDCKPIE